MTATYRSVAAAVVEDIRAGRLTPGERIPSLTELVAAHGVGRDAAAAAVRWLVDAGWVRTVHGKGTWVCDEPGQDEPPSRGDRVEVLERQMAEVLERLAKLEALD